MTAVGRLLVDGGTTTTRVWAVAGTQVLGEARSTIGARDTARTGSRAPLHAAVRELLQEASVQARERDAAWQATEIVAAGMITSPLGLAEVPHVAAPADLAALAAAAHRLSVPEVSPLPVLLLPGVRCGMSEPSFADVASFDVMRGEEAVCLGLVETGLLSGSAVAMSVGSHWKLVEIDDGRIAACSTTLSGELLHVLRANTVLSASVDAELPGALSPPDIEALERGILACRVHGLPRAAFMARLLERVPESSPRDRLLFLLGIVVGDTVRHWRSALEGRRVALLGAPPICEAWQVALDAIGAQPSTVAPDDIARAYVAALTAAAGLAGGAR